MSASRDEDLLRRGAVLLSALVLTKDEGLARFREHRVSDKRVSDEQLAKARAVLDGVTYALLGESRDNWKRIEEAHRILSRNEPPVELPAVSRPPTKALPVEDPSAASNEQHEQPVRAPTPGPTPSLAQRPDIGASSPWSTSARVSPTVVPTVSAPPIATPLGASDEEDLDSTAAIDPAVLARASAPTPFRDGPAIPPQRRDDELEVATSGETGAIDLSVIADAIAAYPLPSKLPMTVERYAALVARSADASETELAELHREYAVADAAHRKRIDQEFSEAMSRDAALRQQFGDFLRQWRDWLKQRKS